jgi:hypothetical protein
MPKISAYILQNDGKFSAVDGHSGKILGHCVRTGLTRRRPGSRGSWISSTTESFRCRVDGTEYVGRNGGAGLHINLRPAKRQK